VIFEYAASTASSLEVRPCPADSRCAISAFDGRNSSARSSSPRASRVLMNRPCTESIADAWTRALPSSTFCS
jgi:hypothetical protein